MQEDWLRRGAAEFVGAFALTFVGAGAIAATAGTDLLAVAVAHGLVIGVMASAVGHISGGHFNPAVTFGFLVTRRIAPSLAVVYWLSQFVAAVVGALLLKSILPSGPADAVKLGAPALGPGVGAGAGLLLEVILTFLLVWVIFATAADPGGAFKSIAGLAIGGTITLDILIGGPFSGAVMNPSRAFGPQLVANAWADGWVWYLGPLVGGALGAIAYDQLYLRRPGPEPVGPPETGLEEPRPGETSLS